jgi:hypothetical protein
VRYPGAQTDMKAHEGESWKVVVDGAEEENRYFATLRRVGWLDQKGRVWTKIPPSADFDGGSLTPLLIDARH